jgi:hypothetical protein
MLQIPETTNTLPADAEAVRQHFMQGLCSVEALAAALDKKPTTVRQWIKSGLPCVRFGKDCYPIIDAARQWLIARSNTDVPMTE